MNQTPFKGIRDQEIARDYIRGVLHTVFGIIILLLTLLGLWYFLLITAANETNRIRAIAEIEQREPKTSDVIRKALEN